MDRSEQVRGLALVGVRVRVRLGLGFGLGLGLGLHLEPALDLHAREPAPDGIAGGEVRYRLGEASAVGREAEAALHRAPLGRARGEHDRWEEREADAAG